MKSKQTTKEDLSMTTTPELRRVQRAADKERQAREELAKACSEAHNAGHSLRPIAAAAGKAVETIRQLIFRAAA